MNESNHQSTSPSSLQPNIVPLVEGLPKFGETLSEALELSQNNRLLSACKELLAAIQLIHRRSLDVLRVKLSLTYDSVFPLIWDAYRRWGTSVLSAGLLFCNHSFATEASAPRNPVLTGFWQAHNRILVLQGLQIQHAYRETDTQGLTTDGTLDSETGAVQGWAVQARWQGLVGAAPLWFDAAASDASGQTDYNGYLQNGSKLTPYRAKTGNHWQRTEIRLGYPWSPAALPSLQVVSPLMK